MAKLHIPLRKTNFYVPIAYSTLVLNQHEIELLLPLNEEDVILVCVGLRRLSQTYDLFSDHEMAQLLFMINWHKCNTKSFSALVSQNYIRWTKISSCKPERGQSVSGLRFVTKTSCIQSKCWSLDRDLPNDIIIMILRAVFSNTLGLCMIKTNIIIGT